MKIFKFRMMDWAIIAFVSTLVVTLLYPHQLGVTLYKISMVSLLAVVGYWVDRSLFPYARPDAVQDKSTAMLRRAIIVGAIVIGGSLGA